MTPPKKQVRSRVTKNGGRSGGSQKKASGRREEIISGLFGGFIGFVFGALSLNFYDIRQDCLEARVEALNRVATALQLAGRGGSEGCIYRGLVNDQSEDSAKLREAADTLKEAQRELHKCRFLSSKEENAAIRTAEGILYARQGEFEKAVDAFEGARPDMPKSMAIDALISLSWSQIGLAEENGALTEKLFEEQISSLDSVKATEVTACLLTSKGALRRRLGLFQGKHGKAAEKEGNLKKALSDHDAAIRRSRGKSFLAYYNKGIVLMDLERAREAIGSFRAAANLDKEDSFVHSELSYAYESEGILDRALREAEVAAILDPADADHEEHKGEINIQLGNFVEAVKAFESAFEISPGSARAQYGLGMAFYYLKRYDDSRKWLCAAKASSDESIRGEVEESSQVLEEFLRKRGILGRDARLCEPK